jgi:hypothetical protein
MPIPRDDKAPLEAEVILLAGLYGRYGYRMVAGLMRHAGWHHATTARVARIWRQEGLKVPQKQTPRVYEKVFNNSLCKEYWCDTGD